MAFLRNKVFLATILLLVVVALGWFFLGRTDKKENEGKEDVAVSAPSPKKVVNGPKIGRRKKKGDQKKIVGSDSATHVKTGGESRFVDDPDEDRELTKDETKILAEIREALDAEDLTRLRKVVAKFQLPVSEGGLGGKVHAELRKEAVVALRWFSPKSILDLLPYVADMNAEVVEESYSGIQESLDDNDVGDAERAEILVSLLQIIEDSDRIDALLMTLNNMRNSVKADAILQILNGGTATAKTVMQEQVGFYTDADVEDAKGVEKWLKENPDDPDDAETYGGAKPGKEEDAR